MIWKRAAAGVVLSLVAAGAVATTLGAKRLERDAAWRRDLDELVAYLATDYANLQWQVRAGRVDVVALYAQADTALRMARTVRQAQRAIRRFVAGFADGHLRVESAGDGEGTLTEPERLGEADVTCRRWGYAQERGNSVLSAYPGYRSLPAGPSGFARGRVEVDGLRLAVLRVSTFGLGPHGDACRAAFPVARQHVVGGWCGDECRSAHRRATNDTIAERFRVDLQGLVSDSDVLLVDIRGNGGGTEWATLAARVLSARPIGGAAVGLVPTPPHRRALQDRMAVMDSLVSTLPAGAWRDSVTAVRARIADAARGPWCDASGIWRTGPTGDCHALMHATWTSGLMPVLPQTMREAPGVELVVDRAVADRTPGVWSGPLYLLTDGGTASASEEFAAALVDYAGGRTVGQRTHGAGCGFTHRARTLRLPATGLVVRAPDCTRYRRDGAPEGLGVSPDIALDTPGRWRGRTYAHRVVRSVLEDYRSTGSLTKR